MNPDMIICQYWTGIPGSCVFGNSCHYLHPEGDDGWEEVSSKKVVKEKPAAPTPKGTQPVIIPIGPQCSGKTTYLASRGNVMDCNIDEVQGVYIKVSVQDLLHSSEKRKQEAFKQIVNGTSMHVRCSEVMSGEQGLVFLLLNGAISLEIFIERLLALELGASDVIPLFLQVISEQAEILGSEFSMKSSTVDIYIREAIFPHGVTSAQGALSHAANTRPDRPVAWGNTNLRPRDYESALHLAERTGRPVEFARWGCELPRVEITELLRRNLHRFAETGRYIPVVTLERCLGTAEELLATHTTPEALAAAAGYSLDPISMRVTKRARVAATTSTPPPPPLGAVGDTPIIAENSCNSNPYSLPTDVGDEDENEE